MQTGENKNPYDLEDRTLQFARRVRQMVKKLPKTMSNFEDGKQLIKSSGSIGANYIEANEALGNKDFLMHIKISRKEAKESQFWIRLLDLEGCPELEKEHCAILQEAIELTLIFGAIFHKKSN
jgi:four helix bundle protein